MDIGINSSLAKIRSAINAKREADGIAAIVKAARENPRKPTPPTSIDPAKYDLRNYPETRAFLHGAYAMNGAAEIERTAAKADAIALLTLLQDTTQSRSVAERCAKAKAVLS